MPDGREDDEVVLDNAFLLTSTKEEDILIK